MASYPTTVKTYSALSSGKGLPYDVVQSYQDEITAIETDLLAAWSSFTPTWTNLTVGNGTSTGKYKKIGKIVWFKIDLVWGSTTSISSSVSASFPVTAQTGGSYTVAHGESIDASTGDSFSLMGRLASGSAFAVLTDNGTKNVAVTATVPFTWTTSDELHITGFYEIP